MLRSGWMVRPAIPFAPVSGSRTARRRTSGVAFRLPRARARINGELGPLEISVDLLADRANASPRAVLWGPIGVESIAYDEALGQRRAPWRVRLEVDGVPLFDADIGQRLTDEVWSIDLPEPSTDAPEPFRQRLYRPSERDRGRLACGTVIREGIHRLRVIVQDASGLADTVTTTVSVQPMPRLGEWMARPCGRGMWDVGVHIGPAGCWRPRDDAPVGGSDRRWAPLSGKHHSRPSRLGLVSGGDLLHHPLGADRHAGPHPQLRRARGVGTRPEPRLKGRVRGGSDRFAVGHAAPRWLDIRLPVACTPAARRQRPFRSPVDRIGCDLLETYRPKEEGVWRWVAAPRRTRAGRPVPGPWARWRDTAVETRAGGAGKSFYRPVLDLARRRVDPGDSRCYVLRARLVGLVEDAPRGGRVPRGSCRGSCIPDAQDEILLIRSDVQRIGPARTGDRRPVSRFDPAAGGAGERGGGQAAGHLWARGIR